MICVYIMKKDVRTWLRAHNETILCCLISISTQRWNGFTTQAYLLYFAYVSTLTAMIQSIATTQFCQMPYRILIPELNNT